MKKEVTLNLFSNGQPIKVTTTLVITQEEINQIFARKEQEFMTRFGCAPAPQPSPFNQVNDFAYDSYEEDSEEESEEESQQAPAARSYTPYASQQAPSQPSTPYTPYASLNAQSQFPKSYHEQLENGYNPYNTWRVNVPANKKIVIEDN